MSFRLLKSLSFAAVTAAMALTLLSTLAMTRTGSGSDGRLVLENDDFVEETVELRPCQCKRKIARRWRNDNAGDKSAILPNASTCSPSSFLRGGGQKVVAFSLYEPLPGPNRSKLMQRYSEGVWTNLSPIRELYGPEWVVRVYHDLDDVSDLCRVACAEPMLDLCDAREIPQFGNVTFMFPRIWRFLPSLDPQVDVFLSRDLDSVVGVREWRAVRQFLASRDADVHVMRDHPAHTTTVMAGMWGAKMTKIREHFYAAFKKLNKNRLLRSGRGNKGADQEVLTHFFWPWARRRALAHDSYFCREGYYATAWWRPFPTQREEGLGNFVGGVLRNNASLKLDKTTECPYECRPKKHKDWLHC